MPPQRSAFDYAIVTPHGHPENNAQNASELLGTILRIDVNVPDGHPQGFVAPAGNAGLPRPEIWSLGWRNPWKFSFDDPLRGGTGAMLVADVGQGAWEEIDYEPAGRGGRNYGWRVREGAHPYTGSTTLPMVDPIYDYDHGVGRSITGGYVYRGAATPAMRGSYFFGDYVTRRVWSLNLRVNATTGEASPSTAADLVDHTAELGGTTILGGISGFGVDAVGELYVINHSPGTILKIVGPPCGADRRPHHPLSGVSAPPPGLAVTEPLAMTAKRARVAKGTTHPVLRDLRDPVAASEPHR